VSLIKAPDEFIDIQSSITHVFEKYASFSNNIHHGRFMSHHHVANIQLDVDHVDEYKYLESRYDQLSE
jgi:hypothetical protein